MSDVMCFHTLFNKPFTDYAFSNNVVETCENALSEYFIQIK